MKKQETPQEPTAEARLINVITDLIKDQEKKLNEATHWYVDGHEPLEQRILTVIHRYERIAVGNLSSVKQFRDDMLINIKAWKLVVDMAANASTHQEKNARLRGMIELLESAAKHLSEMQFDMDNHWWRYEDVFASDYPTLHYVRRIHELEDEVKRLKGEPTF